MRTIRLAAAFSALALALTVTACGGDDGGDDAGSGNSNFAAGSTMEKLNKAQKLRVGTKFDQPGFGLKGLSGKPEGFDVEMAKLVAKALDIPEDKIEYTETPSTVREQVIQQDKVDIVVATYTINDKRKEVVSFAGPYYMAGQSILVLADNDDIESEDDLVGQPVCSVTGSTPAAKLAEIGAEPVLTDTYSNCLEPLRSGQVVAVSTDNVILAGLAAQNEGEFKVVGKPFTEEPYGIGLALEDTEFRMWINDVLEKAEEDGRYEEAWNETAGTVLPFVDPPAVDRYEN